MRMADVIPNRQYRIRLPHRRQVVKAVVLSATSRKDGQRVEHRIRVRETLTGKYHLLVSPTSVLSEVLERPVVGQLVTVPVGKHSEGIGKDQVYRVLEVWGRSVRLADGPHELVVPLSSVRALPKRVGAE